MKYMEKILETGTSRMDSAPVLVPVSGPTPASAPAFTAVKKTFTSLVKPVQPIIVKPSDNYVIVPSKDEMMSNANKA